MVAAELKVVGGKHAGQVIPLNRRKFLIGREQDCQLRPNSDMVSRHHCVFSIDDFSVRLRDLGSTNGTLVNGERIRKETVLSSGDRILIGNLDFELVIRQGVSLPDSDSKTMPPIPLTNEDTQVNSRTVLEMPTTPIAAAEPVTSKAPETTQVVPIQSIAEPSLAAAAAPMVSVAETMVMQPQGQMMPGQYPYQPMMNPMMQPMMQPMGYPGGMYGGMPYQQMMPGYGQMYPQMMPQMGYPMQGQPVAPAATPAPAAAAGIEVALPDPSLTGAKESEAPKGSSGASTSDSAKPTGAADAIIKQYMGRRPGNS
ncbi:MAG: FHA domain-containing protein [Planctomycetota bacterium]|nr:MAG: FHA domain-containing protein [Planctomycetota bacterium]